MVKHIIVGISGASGSIYGVRILEALREISDVETHLIISKMAHVVMKQELEYSLDEVKALADHVYPSGDLAACISSGSFKTYGMVIAPCSMRSVAEIATSLSTSLLTRAADVVLKERRKLVLMARETPLTTVHLRNMVTISEMGGIIAPPVPAFYQNPESMNDIIDHSVGRVLDLLDIDHNLVNRWSGLPQEA